MLAQVVDFVFAREGHVAGRGDDLDPGSEDLERQVETYLVVSGAGGTVRHGIGPDLLGVLDDGDGLEDALGTHRDGIGSVSEDIPEDHVADALLVVLLFDVECGVLDGPELHGTLLDAFEFGFGEASGIGDGRVDIVTLLLGEVLHTERGVQPAAERQYDFFLGIHGFISFFISDGRVF